MTKQERREWAEVLRSINKQDMRVPHIRAGVIRKVEELADLLDPSPAETECPTCGCRVDADAIRVVTTTRGSATSPPETMEVCDECAAATHERSYDAAWRRLRLRIRRAGMTRF